MNRYKKKKAKPKKDIEKQNKAVTEAMRAVISQAVWDGYIYGYSYKRWGRQIDTFLQVVSDIHDGHKKAKDAWEMAKKYLTVDVPAELKKLNMSVYREQAFLLCISCMVLAMHDMKWSRQKLDILARNTIVMIEYNDWQRCYQNILDVTGVDIRKLGI